MVVSFLQLHSRTDALDSTANLGVLLMGETRLTLQSSDENLFFFFSRIFRVVRPEVQLQLPGDPGGWRGLLREQGEHGGEHAARPPALLSLYRGPPGAGQRRRQVQLRGDTGPAVI